MADPTPPLVDAHAHVFARSLALTPDRRYAPQADALLEDYLAHLDTHGLHAGVLIQPSFLGTDNRYMLDAIRQAPRRLKAWRSWTNMPRPPSWSGWRMAASSASG